MQPCVPSVTAGAAAPSAAARGHEQEEDEGREAGRERVSRGGAISLGFCLWQTGAAEWMAIGWLSLLNDAPWLTFIMGVAFLVLIMTNFIMNVAAIAITLPVALVMAPYVGVAPEVVMFASLASAGMPFLLLVGAAPNAIAYTSGQFTTKEFFTAGIPASILLMVVLALFVWIIWPLMGMPVLLP